MVDTNALLQSLTQFATRSVTDYDVALVLEELGQQARSVLGLDGAGITLRVHQAGKATQYISATDDMTLAVERAQDRFSEGACVEAIRAGAPVVAEDVRDFAAQWPRYVPAVLDAGFRGVAGIPVLTAGRVVGAVNAYRANAGSWTTEELAAGALFANVATVYIANASAYVDQATLAAQLQGALDSRVRIEQAKGVLAERLGVDVDEAFEVMRRHARNQRTKLNEVAADVLGGRETFEG